MSVNIMLKKTYRCLLVVLSLQNAGIENPIRRRTPSLSPGGISDGKTSPCNASQYSLSVTSVGEINQLKIEFHPIISFNNNNIIIIIIYHDFLPTPKRGSHVKSDKRNTQSSRYTS